MNLQRMNFVQKHPVLAFLLINFAWTWAFWFAAIPFRDQNDLLVMALVMIGGYGPALGGILTLGLRSGQKQDFSVKRILLMIGSALAIFAVMVLRYRVGNVANYDTLAADLTLTVTIIVAALFASLVGGWVVSSAFSKNEAVCSLMGSIFPKNLSFGWILFGLGFYPVMILAGWGLSALLGMGVEYPGLWGSPILEVLPLYLLTFVLVMIAQGGNEEPGWRGLLQPELQKRFSPLVAALIVSIFWSMWHLPLYLNGFYGDDLVGGMIGGGVFRVLLSIFLAWVYNRSGGSMFLMIVLHTAFNVMVNFLPTSNLGLLVLWLVVVVVIVFKDKMYRRLPAA